MPRVLPSQLTDDELLALLDSGDEVEPETSQIFDYDNDIVPFMSFYNITPGEAKVSKKLLYKLYKAYSKNPVDPLTFIIKIGTYVNHNRNHVLLNMDHFAISKYIYEAETKRDKTKSLTYQRHFNWYISEAGVESGRTWIEGFILFYQYKDFCKSRRVTPKFGYVNFHKFLKLHFQHRRIKENRALWFRVDERTANTYSDGEKDVIRKARTSKETRGSQKDSQPEVKKAETQGL